MTPLDNSSSPLRGWLEFSSKPLSFESTMPIYEYVCSKCQHDFEELIFNTSEKVACPECGSAKVERAMSVFASVSGDSFRPSSGSSCGGCAKSSCSGCSHG